MSTSLCSLKLKLLMGYLLLVMLFGMVLTLLVYERTEMKECYRYIRSLYFFEYAKPKPL